MTINSLSLKSRVLSAVILIPIVVFTIWAGNIPFAVFLMIVAALALRELLRLPLASWGALKIIGVFYVGASFWLCYVLRQDHGFALTILFFATLWASDVGAYFAGKIIGGPKMGGMISPNKTWAGYAGALLAPSLALMTMFPPHLALGFGIAIGMTGQAGDLLVSLLKRQAHVKDTGTSIPGHGGVLDRIDSIMPSVPVYLALIKMAALS